jgi:glycosyltransferase involved in cell wall biosynthesis
VVSIQASDPLQARGIEHRLVVTSSGVLPTHEYLPDHTGPQAPVSGLSEAEAANLIADYEAAIDELAPEIDVIVAHHANVSTVAAARVARRRGLPYVVFVHGTGIEPRFLGGYADPIWRQITEAVAGAAAVVVATTYVRDQLVRPLIDVPPGRVTVLPCGVDPEQLRPATDAVMRSKYRLPEHFVICPGALTTVKGPQNVVAATRQYADLAPTVFIGDGELRSEVEDLLGDNGRVLGFVSESDKAALINEATILTAAPEKLEHFGLIYVEAMAAGTVPVAYCGGGVDSIITPDVGVLTERNPDTLGSAIRTRLERPAETERMAVRARRRAIEQFDSRVLSERFAVLVENAAGEAPPRLTRSAIR